MGDNVVDYPVKLSTAQSGSAEFVTKKLNGVLEAMIISTSSPIQISISIARLPIFPFGKTYLAMFEDVNYSGEHYIPLRVTAVRGDNEKKDFNQERWVLNDKIRILIKGAKGTNTSIVFRYT